MVRTIGGICLILGISGMVLEQKYADGCAMVRPFGYKAPLEVAQESAIIIWDAENKTEHFIRRASFKTEANDFGFLVPTPSQPELAEAKDVSFRMLEGLTRPILMLPPGRVGGKAPGNAPPPAVEVLEVKRVAGFDAAVLKANDPLALSDWLKKNGYQSRPELTSWLDTYVKSGWIITAFKIATDTPKSKAINTSAVRMSFKTEKPFYPYREPSDAREVPANNGAPAPASTRLLRVYVLAKERVDATVGEKVWPGKTVWANKIDNANCTLLAKHLKLESWKHEGEWWLTEFEDRSSPRPGTDELYFAAAAEQKSISRPPVFGFPRPIRPLPPIPVPAPAPKIEPKQ